MHATYPQEFISLHAQAVLGTALRKRPAAVRSTIMVSRKRSAADLARLQMLWLEPAPGDEAGIMWGQLAGAVSRLALVLDGLQYAAGRRDATRAFDELTFYIENYFVRLYELRERAFGLVESLVGQKLQKAKNPAKRLTALARVPPAASDLRDCLETLLKLLDDDIDVRNAHTHSRFLDFQLVLSSSAIYEVENLLLETRRTNEGKVLRRIVKREVRRLASEYIEKALLVRHATWVLLETAEARIGGGTA